MHSGVFFCLCFPLFTFKFALTFFSIWCVLQPNKGIFASWYFLWLSRPLHTNYFLISREINPDLSEQTYVFCTFDFYCFNAQQTIAHSKADRLIYVLSHHCQHCMEILQRECRHKCNWLIQLYCCKCSRKLFATFYFCDKIIRIPAQCLWNSFPVCISP